MSNHLLSGNIVTPQEAFFGQLSIIDGQITAITRLADCRDGEDWILPGFIDVHIHGLGHGSAVDNPDLIAKMAEFGPSSGLTGFLPTLAGIEFERQLAFVSIVAKMSKNLQPGMSRIIGSHLEGPFIAPSHHGGMTLDNLQPATLDLTEQILAAADGTLRLMTISPELEGAPAVIARLKQAGTVISAGHTGCNKEQLEQAVQAGLNQVCHLFDTFDGRIVDNGVSTPCLADLVLIDERLNLELIPDGVHVPPDLVKLARLAAGADRLIAITDGLPGAGLTAEEYARLDPALTLSLGRESYLAPDGVFRLRDRLGSIVGSSLTLNRAFHNLTTRFGFTPVEAARMTSTNAAVALGLGSLFGSLQTGLLADIAVLAADRLTVKQTFIGGEIAYEA